MDDDHSDPSKLNGPTTEDLVAEQPAAEAELLPAVADRDEIEPYPLATPVEVFEGVDP